MYHYHASIVSVFSRARKELTHSINHDKYYKTQLRDKTCKKETKREGFLKWCGLLKFLSDV